MFLGNPIYLHLLFSSHILLFISLLLLSLSLSLIPLSRFPPLLPPAFPSVGLEIKPCHLPTHCTLLCSLGCESAHYSNKYLRGVRGIYAEPLQRRPPTPNPSVLLVLAGVLFCLPEPALMACFSQHLSHVLEQHLAKFKCTHVQVSLFFFIVLHHCIWCFILAK